MAFDSNLWSRDSRRRGRWGVRCLLVGVIAGAIVASLYSRISPQFFLCDQICLAMEDANEGKYPERIRAKSFEVVDDAGAPRIRIGMERGNPTVSIRDEKARDRIRIELIRHGGSALHESPIVTFIDEKREYPLMISCSDDTGPYIVLRGSDGKDRIGLGAVNDVPQITLWGRNMKKIWEAPTTSAPAPGH